MNNQSLIIYESNLLFDIFNELADHLPFSIIQLTKNELVKLNQFKTRDYLIVSEKKIQNINNQIVLNKFPLNIFKLIEKVNIEFLRLKFNEQSEIKIGNYLFDLNARKMIYHNQNLKLTEKEINFIIYLFNSKQSVNIKELQKEVWGYQAVLETHTVETHIYRLRKKILKKFNDKKFIKSTLNGYQIN